MAERLTEKNKISCFEYDLANFEHKVKEFNDYDAFYAYNMAVRKLGKLEDIMEKYHCNDIEELDKKLTDADTWQKACELACDVLRDINYKIYNEDRIDFENTFYQQAKKEGNDE